MFFVSFSEASEVFHEKIRNLKATELEINDIDPKILSQMIGFLYTGEFETKKISVVKDLLLAANTVRTLSSKLNVNPGR